MSFFTKNLTKFKIKYLKSNEMKLIIKNIFSIIIGIVVGGIVNMGIVMLSSSVISPPNGGDVTTMEGLNETIHLFEPKHFLFPFLAHSIGTLVGAFVAALVAVNKHLIFSLVVGFFFLLGGIYMIIAIDAPLWFEVLDALFAYIPMAWLGYQASLLTRKTA